MTRIRRLDPETRREIAAGEVITRPVAVVRELVENSLDADATKIAVAVEGDGTDTIEVRDDGHGMSHDDAVLAIEEHTTSKLADDAAVGRVSTLGFRGEALSSIATVADLTVTTNDGGPRGTCVHASAGGVETEPVGRPQGTTVTVESLFRNRPARRKQLAGSKAEFARISALLSRYALCHPTVGFSLSHDGRETFSTPGTGLVDALLGVYGRDVAGQSTTFSTAERVTVDAKSEDDHTYRVDGALCYPSVTRATRDHVHVSVNGRPLTDESLRAAVVAGYGSLLPSNRAPVAVVSVHVPTELVDHNVHPAKAEVAFRGEGVEAVVERAVSDALSTADLRRSADVAMDLDTTLAPVDGESRLADVGVVGQFRGTYLLCAADDDLLIVDQHAAHERVNYERLRAAVDAVETQALDPPVTLSLSASERALVDAHADELERLGYEVSAFGGGTVRVSGVPAPLGRTATPASLRDVLATLDDAGASAENARDELLKTMACHPSLKAGDELSRDDAERLVHRLGACDQPYACPHGRPTVLSLDEETLARGFERGNTRFE